MSLVLNSGLKIFDIIGILWENPTSRDELKDKLLKKGIISDVDTITKYLRTLRGLDFEIVSVKRNLYQIVKSPFKFELSKEDNEGFFVLKNISDTVFETKKEQINFLQYKLQSLFQDLKTESKENSKIFSKISKNLLNDICCLAKCIENETKAEFLYNNKKNIIIPYKIRYRKNGFFLDGYNINEQKTEIYIIEKIKNLKEKSKQLIMEEPANKTVFKIKGSLIKNYVLREGEIAQYKKYGITIQNFREEKEELYNRLMKYGRNCEIISPEKDKQRFIEKLKQTIEHYQLM